MIDSCHSEIPLILNVNSNCEPFNSSLIFHRNEICPINAREATSNVTDLQKKSQMVKSEKDMIVVDEEENAKRTSKLELKINLSSQSLADNCMLQLESSVLGSMQSQRTSESNSSEVVILSDIDSDSIFSSTDNSISIFEESQVEF